MAASIQCGNRVFESGNASTVITLNTESEERFKHDLIEALLSLKAVNLDGVQEIYLLEHITKLLL